MEKAIRENISVEIIENLKKQQNNKCNICNFKLEEGKYHIDYINPLSNGGNENDINNLQILCIECHFKKHGRKTRKGLSESMISLTCNLCGRVVAGFTKRHVNTLMAQHKIKHQNDALEEKEKNE